MQKRGNNKLLIITSILIIGALFTISFQENTGQAIQKIRGNTRTNAMGVEPPMTFGIIGDFGLAGQPEADVASLIRSWNPSYVITTGDNNYPDGLATTIVQNIGQYYCAYIYNPDAPPSQRCNTAGVYENKFFPVLGNHDWGITSCTGIMCSQPYRDYFMLPNNERYYDIRLGPVHFYFLDSDPHEPDGIISTSRQAQWLKNELQQSDEPWKIVVLHHAPYSSSTTHGSTVQLQWPYQQWGADIVLAGHDHTYERLLINGFPYIVNGLGGRSIYYGFNPIAGSQVRYNADFGALRLDATSNELLFRFYTRRNILIDSYTLRK